MLSWQSWIVGTVWTIRPKIFTVWLFTETICWPWDLSFSLLLCSCGLFLDCSRIRCQHRPILSLCPLLGVGEGSVLIKSLCIFEDLYWVSFGEAHKKGAHNILYCTYAILLAIALFSSSFFILPSPHHLEWPRILSRSWPHTLSFPTGLSVFPRQACWGIVCKQS